LSVVYISLQMFDGGFYVSMLSIVCRWYLFADVRWWFLCEYVINCLLFISLCRCSMVVFMWVCYQLFVVYISLQMFDGGFYVSMLSLVCPW